MEKGDFPFFVLGVFYLYYKKVKNLHFCGIFFTRNSRTLGNFISRTMDFTLQEVFLFVLIWKIKVIIIFSKVMSLKFLYSSKTFIWKSKYLIFTVGTISFILLQRIKITFHFTKLSENKILLSV